MNTAPASCWQLPDRSLPLGPLPCLMGILNVTPDSFSDGGQFEDQQLAVEQALQLVSDGAGIIDVGGESTRPGSEPVNLQEELARVIPLIEQLCSLLDVPVSIDTSKAEVARQAMAAGAEIINDVTGLEGDPAMLDVVSESSAGVCLMHMQGNPRTMQDDPHYDDVVEEIFNYLAARRDTLQSAGIARDRVCLDPGIGFGKTDQHNLTLLANSDRFHELGCPILVGHSRKGYIATVLGDKQLDRTAGTIGTALALAGQGVQIIRLHDIAPVSQALALFAASGGMKKGSNQHKID